jgi:hypothetical protein
MCLITLHFDAFNLGGVIGNVFNNFTFLTWVGQSFRRKKRFTVSPFYRSYFFLYVFFTHYIVNGVNVHKKFLSRIFLSNFEAIVL